MNNQVQPFEYKEVFTANFSELMITHDSTEKSRNYDFDNIVFAHLTQGTKAISIGENNRIELQKDMVIMATTPVQAKVEFPFCSIEKPTTCFTLEVEKQKVWDILDRIYRNDQIEELVLNDHQLAPIQIYDYKQAKQVMETLKQLQQLLKSENRFKDHWIQLKIEELVLCSLQTNLYHTLINSFAQSKLSDSPLSEVIQFIKQNLQEKIAVSDLAQKACMSEATFYRKFKQSLGVTPGEYIQNERISKAKNLLIDSNIKIGDISYQLGFSSLSYFTATFKKEVGSTPYDFRNA